MWSFCVVHVVHEQSDNIYFIEQSISLILNVNELWSTINNKKRSFYGSNIAILWA